jgi:hypothetical protein
MNVKKHNTALQVTRNRIASLVAMRQRLPGLGGLESMPTSPAQRMSKALKSKFVPVLEAAGFSGTFPRFRRNSEAAIQFLSIQYDKAGSALFLEFGNHPPGEKNTSWGEIVPECELILEHIPFDSRARLQARSGAGSTERDWFHFGDFGENTASYSNLAESIATMFSQVESWLSTQQIGPNVSPNGL